MSNSYIIEVGDLAVGLVTRQSASRGFLFFASDPRLASLEQRTFGTPRQAEALARDLIQRRSTGSGGARRAP
jgi:hypothetical protein